MQNRGDKTSFSQSLNTNQNRANNMNYPDKFQGQGGLRDESGMGQTLRDDDRQTQRFNQQGFNQQPSAQQQLDSQPLEGQQHMGKNFPHGTNIYSDNKNF